MEFSAPWMLANLSRTVEKTPQGAEEVWSVEVHGPTEIYTEWQQMVGRPRMPSVRVRQGMAGTIEASTFEGLRLLVRQVAALVPHDRRRTP